MTLLELKKKNAAIRAARLKLVQETGEQPAQEEKAESEGKREKESNEKKTRGKKPKEREFLVVEPEMVESDGLSESEPAKVFDKD